MMEDVLVEYRKRLIETGIFTPEDYNGPLLRIHLRISNTLYYKDLVSRGWKTRDSSGIGVFIYVTSEEVLDSIPEEFRNVFLFNLDLLV